MNLQRKLVTPVAQRLRDMGVPFAITSAYDRSQMPGDKALDGAPLLGKPTVSSRLLAVVREMLSGAK